MRIQAPWDLSPHDAAAIITRHEARLPSQWWTTNGQDAGLTEAFARLLLPYTREQQLAITLDLLASEIFQHVWKLDRTLGGATARDIERLLTTILADLVLLTRAHVRDLYVDDPEEDS